jgi:hypothetical protein
VANPRFYASQGSIEISPDFNYSFGMTLTDSDGDFKQMTISASIDGNIDTGTLTTSVGF